MKSDMQLKRDVEDELSWDAAINIENVGVEVLNGVVTLSGHPASFAEKIAAEKAAARVIGVRGIVIEMAVRLPHPDVRTDEDIANTVRSILEWTVGVNNAHVQVQVEKGTVTLDGEVDWGYQSHASCRAISHLRGVTGVIDNIRIRGAASADDIARGIRDAMHRHSEREMKHIGISIDNGTVTLTGEVGSLAERRLIAGTARATPGVRVVVDHLNVK